MSYPDIFVLDELAHFMEVVGWAQDTVLRKEGLRPLHLAFMRRAGMYGRVSYSRIAQETKMPKEEISRAGEFLVESRLAKVIKDPSDKRRRLLFLTKRGELRLYKINSEFGTGVFRRIGASSPKSKRLWEFTIWLWNTNRYLPHSRVANPNTYLPAYTPVNATYEPDSPTIRVIREIPRPPESNPWQAPPEW